MGGREQRIAAVRHRAAKMPDGWAGKTIALALVAQAERALRQADAAIDDAEEAVTEGKYAKHINLLEAV